MPGLQPRQGLLVTGVTRGSIIASASRHFFAVVQSSGVVSVGLVT